MTTLEITLTTLTAVLWVLGAYSTYACIMLVRPLPGRRAQIVTLAIWPFVVLWVVCSSRSRSARHAGG